MSHNATSKAHAAFPGPANTTLVSADGVEFHIESSQLARASGWFRTLFTLPQGETKQDAIAISEDALTLEVLLHLCCGTGLAPGLSRLANLGDLELCLLAAEKYEMAEALEILPLVLHKADMQEDALHLYALASKYGQECVAANALKRLQTMRLEFDNMPHLDYAQLTRLVARRQERIEKFCWLLVDNASDAPFYLENTNYCTRRNCQKSHPRTNPQAWNSLAIALQTCFILWPSIEALESKGLVKEKLDAVKDVTCGWSGCHFPQYEWRDIRFFWRRWTKNERTQAACVVRSIGLSG